MVSTILDKITLIILEKEVNLLRIGHEGMGV
jgi:hypothetical protein